MPYNIQTALEQLEQSLKDVDSARKQVQDVVSSNEEMQKVFAKYVGSFGKLQKEIESWVDQIDNWQKTGADQTETLVSSIQETCGKVESGFSSKVEEAAQSFKKNVSEQIANVDKTREALGTEVKALSKLQDAYRKATNEVNAFGEKLNELSQELSSSQKSQDGALESIAKKLSAISSEIETVKSQCEKLDTIEDKIDNANSGIKSIEKSVSDGVTSLQKQNDAAFSKQSTIVKENQESLMSSVNSLSKKMENYRKTFVGIGMGVIVLCIIIIIVICLNNG